MKVSPVHSVRVGMTNWSTIAGWWMKVQFAVTTALNVEMVNGQGSHADVRVACE